MVIFTTMKSHIIQRGGGTVLSKFPVPGRPTNVHQSRTRAYCACSRCGLGLFGHFSLVYHFSFVSPSLWKTARYRPKYCLKGPLSPKTTKQPTTLYSPACIKQDLRDNQNPLAYDSCLLNTSTLKCIFLLIIVTK